MTDALIGCDKALLLLDVESGKIDVLHDQYEQYAGITWDHKRVYVGCNDALLVVDGCNITELDVPFNITGQPHQLFYWPTDYRLYWVMAGHDCVRVMGVNSLWTRWEPVATMRKGGVRLRSQHFYNSIFATRSSLYVLAMMHGDSLAHKFDVGLNHRSSRDMGNKAHNVWLEDGFLNSCSSAEGVIRSGNDVICDLGPNAFPRGVAIMPGMRLVGISPEEARAQRNNHPSEVRVFDDAWQHVKTINLAKKFGQVRDIRLLSEHDLCHNGLQPPGVL